MDGEGNKIPPPAAILNVARQFLKDNRIEAQAVQGSPLAGLADLPIFDDDNIIPLRNARWSIQFKKTLESSFTTSGKN